MEKDNKNLKTGIGVAVAMLNIAVIIVKLVKEVTKD